MESLDALCAYLVRRGGAVALESLEALCTSLVRRGGVVSLQGSSCKEGCRCIMVGGDIEGIIQIILVINKQIFIIMGQSYRASF